MLGPLAALWGTVAACRVALYRSGWRRVHRLDRPVVSVGGLSVGGAGKTPAVATLAALLQDAGLRPAILSRGYGRHERRPRLVSRGDGAGVRADPATAGDEPAWLARALPRVPVAVAARREAAAELVLAATDADLFLLDDGFQHVRVARQADLLVVDARAPFWDDRPLPAGRLRERPSAAARAHGFLLVGDAAARSARAHLQRRWPGRPVHDLVPSPAAVWEPGAHLTAPPSPVESLPTPVLAFAGIARPGRFFSDLAARGIAVAETRSFPDHHPFRAADLAELAVAARRTGAAALVTTEKDAVRLAGSPQAGCWVWRYRLEAAAPGELVAWLVDRAGAAPAPGAGAPS